MNPNGQTTGTSPVVSTKDGKPALIVVPDLQVPVNRIFNFVEMNRSAYFEQHSIEWCLDEIINRGIAEITRQVKTQVKAAENRAAGALLKEFNMSPSEAKALLAKLQAEAAKAKLA